MQLRILFADKRVVFHIIHKGEWFNLRGETVRSHRKTFIKLKSSTLIG
jgi:hypothetical protein